MRHSLRSNSKTRIHQHQCIDIIIVLIDDILIIDILNKEITNVFIIELKKLGIIFPNELVNQKINLMTINTFDSMALMQYLHDNGVIIPSQINNSVFESTLEICRKKLNQIISHFPSFHKHVKYLVIHKLVSKLFSTWASFHLKHKYNLNEAFNKAVLTFHTSYHCPFYYAYHFALSTHVLTYRRATINDFIIAKRIFRSVFYDALIRYSHITNGGSVIRYINNDTQKSILDKKITCSDIKKINPLSDFHTLFQIQFIGLLNKAFQ